MASAGIDIEAQEYYRELEHRNLVALWTVAGPGTSTGRAASPPAPAA
jgi:hypothetical protein